MSEATKLKIKEAMLRIGHKPPSQKGATRSLEARVKISLKNKGYRHTDEVRQKMSKNRGGEKNHFFGKVHSKKSIQKMSKAKLGKRPANYILDRILAKNKHALRQTPEWKNWRNNVFERDRYTCKECNKTGGYLEPHHIIPIRNDFAEKLFDTNNGITLCRPCHQKTIWKESDFEKKYLDIVAAQM